MLPYRLLTLQVHHRICQWLLGSSRCSPGHGPCVAEAGGREVHSFWPRQLRSVGSPRSWTFSNPELDQNLCLENLEKKKEKKRAKGHPSPKAARWSRKACCSTSKGRVGCVKWVGLGVKPQLCHFLWLWASIWLLGALVAFLQSCGKI